MKFEINVSGFEDEDIESSVIEAIARQMVERLKESVNRRIDALIEQTAAPVIAERIEGEITVLLEKGWTETDRFGNPQHGKKVTLADRVEAALSTKDAYDKKKIVALVDATIQKRFSDTLDDATRRLKAKIDELINSTIEETITGEIRTKLRGALSK